MTRGGRSGERPSRAVAAGLAVALALLAAAGCASMAADSVQRTAEGPTAEEIFAARFQTSYKRQPTFDETVAFRAAMDERTAEYFVRRPDVASTPRASQIRTARRVFAGMLKDEVLLLAGEPLAATRDAAAMREASGGSWPFVAARAQEMWIYPAGWHFYFHGDQLIDMTHVGRPAP